MAEEISVEDILKESRRISSVYTSIHNDPTDAVNIGYAKKVVAAILSWQAICDAVPDRRVSRQVARLAGWEAEGFSVKLMASMKEPISIEGFAKRLGVRPRTFEQVFRATRPSHFWSNVQRKPARSHSS